MGFFSKIGKSLKKVFKKIGNGIKSAVGKVGKFMDRLGIVGQIGLAFILPGIGGLLSRGVGILAGSANPVLAGIGKVLTTAGKFANTAGNAFKTVTDGVLSFVGNIGKGMVNKVGTLLGRDSLLLPSGPANITEGFSTWMRGVAEDASNITSPFREAATNVTSELIEAPYQKGVDQIFNGGFEDALPNVEDDFISGFKVPEVRPLDLTAPLSEEVPADFMQRLVKQEAKDTTSYLQRAADYGMELARKTTENFSSNFSSQVATGIAQRTGLAPTPEYTTTNVTNVIPQFSHDSTILNNMYNSQGINYGATWDNRILYHAAQQRAA